MFNIPDDRFDANPQSLPSDVTCGCEAWLLPIDRQLDISIAGDPARTFTVTFWCLRSLGVFKVVAAMPPVVIITSAERRLLRCVATLEYPAMFSMKQSRLI
jgi:hypothetical protein